MVYRNKIIYVKLNNKNICRLKVLGGIKFVWKFI